MLKADDFLTQTREISGLTVNIVSYKIGKTYYCHIDNVDPGATIAKSEGESAEAVLREAMDLAMSRLTAKT